VAQPADSAPSRDGAISLVLAAAQDSLPPHQYMDPETVTWIAANRPDFAIDQVWDVPRLKLPLAQLAIPASWHLTPATVDSIHGTRHLMRTAAHAALLASQQGLDRETCLAAAVGGAIHDCRRQHDQNDRGHGARAAEWFREHTGMVLDHFGLRRADLDVDQLVAAVELHDVPYEQFDDRQKQQYAAGSDLVDVLKTADALDRYRLPKLKWWLRDEYLRLPPPIWLKALAYRLVLRSEASHLFGVPSDHSVATALAHEGIT
jgi:hypothetical protein